MTLPSFADTFQQLPASGGAAALGYYPPDAYGFFALSCPVEAAKGNSSPATFVVRMWVPASQPIAKVGLAINTAGTWVSNGNVSGHAVYEDDGTKAADTGDIAGTLWTSAGWAVASLTTPVGAASSGRYVRVMVVANGWSTLQIQYTTGTKDVVLNGGNGVTNRRNVFASTPATFPASINPATYGTPNDFMPLMGLASS